MLIIKISFIVLLLVGTLGINPASAHDIKIHNYLDDFLKFHGESKSLTFEQKVKKWDTEYRSKDKELWDRILYMRATKEESLKKAFKKFPSIINKIRKINNNLNKIVTEEVAWYKSLFPGVQLTFDFYFLVCDFGFGGMVNKIKGRPSMVTCVENSDSFRNNLSHELAHAFHHQENLRIANDESMAATILKEGFAVYCGMKKYNTSLEKQVWGDNPPTGGIQAVDRKKKELMRELLADLKKVDQRTQTKWLGWSRKHKLVPKAGGYYIGYKIYTRQLLQLQFY